MRVRSMVVAALLCLLTFLAPAAQASVRAAAPLCTDISFTGESGQINIRTSPTRFVAWNIRMFEPALNEGPWRVNVYAGPKRVDSKTQTYQPHGSINPVDLPPNAFVRIEAWHTDLKGTEHIFVPNGCTVP